MSKRLNLGCGYPKFHKKGWINVDFNSACKPDALLNVATEPWPWRDSTIDEASCDNLVEHIGWGPNGEDLLMHFMNECHRVLKPDGKLWWRSPDAERWFWGAARDPTHKRFIVAGVADYWNTDHQTHRNYGKAYGYKPWNIISVDVVKPRPDQSFLDFTQRPHK